MFPTIHFSNIYLLQRKLLQVFIFIISSVKLSHEKKIKNRFYIFFHFCFLRWLFFKLSWKSIIGTKCYHDEMLSRQNVIRHISQGCECVTVLDMCILESVTKKRAFVMYSYAFTNLRYKRDSIPAEDIPTNDMCVPESRNRRMDFLYLKTIRYPFIIIFQIGFFVW